MDYNAEWDWKSCGSRVVELIANPQSTSDSEVAWSSRRCVMSVIAPKVLALAECGWTRFIVTVNIQKPIFNNVGLLEQGFLDECFKNRLTIMTQLTGNTIVIRLTEE